MKRYRAFRLLTLRRSALWLAGGVLPIVSLGSCSPEARNTILEGIQLAVSGLFSALLEGLIITLMASDSESSTQPVVQAVFEGLTSWIA